MLRVQDLSVQIESTMLLDGISLDIAAGEVLALVGPNGAGKSTLLKAIMNELPVKHGSVAFHNKNLSKWDSQVCARHLAVLPQKSVLNFPFTGFEVVGLSRTPHSTGAVADHKIVTDVLKYLDASHLADRTYTQLSGGEQQRIQLARVLAQIWEPQEQQRLLLLDEPSSSFDLAHQQILISAIQKLAADGVGIIVVLHDLNIALACADSIAVLCCGQLRAKGAPNRVLTEALLREVFEADTRVLIDPVSGQKFVGLANETRAPNSLESNKQGVA